MAGLLPVGTFPTADGVATLTLDYNDALKATSLNCEMTGTDSLEVRIVGWADDGSEDPNRTYGKVFGPGDDAVAIGQSTNNCINIRTNSHGHLGGWNTYSG